MIPAAPAIPNNIRIGSRTPGRLGECDDKYKGLGSNIMTKLYLIRTGQSVCSQAKTILTNTRREDYRTIALFRHLPVCRGVRLRIAAQIRTECNIRKALPGNYPLFPVIGLSGQIGQLPPSPLHFSPIRTSIIPNAATACARLGPDSQRKTNCRLIFHTLM